MTRLHALGAMALTGSFLGMTAAQQNAVPAKKITLPGAAQVGSVPQPVSNSPAGKELMALRSQFSLQQSQVMPNCAPPTTSRSVSNW